MKSALEELAHSNFFSENYKFKDDSLYMRMLLSKTMKRKRSCATVWMRSKSGS